MAKQNDNLFIAAYQAHREEMAAMRARQWVFLIALAVAHSFYLTRMPINLEYGPMNEVLTLVSYLILAFIIHITLISHIYGFYSLRSRLKKYNASLRDEDIRLAGIVTEDVTMWTFRDLLICGVSILAPPVSVIVLFWGIPLLTPIGLYMVLIGIAVKFRYKLLRVIFPGR
jgi:hypothetical protein